MARRVSPLLESAHRAVAAALERLGRPLSAVDATAGNGHDTLFLARCVGEEGLVLACDVQQVALDATRARLEAAGLAGRVRLVLGGHEHLGRWLDAAAPDGPAPSPLSGVAAAMFNLGFLPGSDKRVVTRPDTTLAALEALLPRLAPGGVISLHLYTGHGGGAEEAAAVLSRAAALPAAAWAVLQSHEANRERAREYLLLLERL